MPTSTVPLDDLTPRDSVMDDPEGRPVLVGSRCAQCVGLAFPARAVCYRCGGRDLSPVALERRGILYSWTTVRVSATRPVPYTVGYVDLPGLRVFGQLTGDAAYRIGDEVEVVRQEPAPDGVTSWGFAPVEEVAGA